MFYLVLTLILITCVLLILIVLVQNSKGGGLASNFSSSNQIMGVKKTSDFLEKATWTLAIALFVFSLLATMTQEQKTAEADAKILESTTNVEQTIPLPNTDLNKENTDNKKPEETDKPN